MSNSSSSANHIKHHQTPTNASQSVYAGGCIKRGQLDGLERGVLLPVGQTGDIHSPAAHREPHRLPYPRRLPSTTPWTQQQPSCVCVPQGAREASFPARLTREDLEGQLVSVEPQSTVGLAETLGNGLVYLGIRGALELEGLRLRSLKTCRSGGWERVFIGCRWFELEAGAEAGVLLRVWLEASEGGQRVAIDSWLRVWKQVEAPLYAYWRAANRVHSTSLFNLPLPTHPSFYTPTTHPSFYTPTTHTPSLSLTRTGAPDLPGHPPDHLQTSVSHHSPVSARRAAPVDHRAAGLPLCLGAGLGGLGAQQGLQAHPGLLPVVRPVREAAGGHSQGRHRLGLLPGRPGRPTSQQPSAL